MGCHIYPPIILRTRVQIAIYTTAFTDFCQETHALSRWPP